MKKLLALFLVAIPLAGCNKGATDSEQYKKVDNLNDYFTAAKVKQAADLAFSLTGLEFKLQRITDTFNYKEKFQAVENYYFLDTIGNNYHSQHLYYVDEDETPTWFNIDAFRHAYDMCQTGDYALNQYNSQMIQHFDYIRSAITEHPEFAVIYRYEYEEVSKVNYYVGKTKIKLEMFGKDKNEKFVGVWSKETLLPLSIDVKYYGGTDGTNPCSDKLSWQYDASKIKQLTPQDLHYAGTYPNN